MFTSRAYIGEYEFHETIYKDVYPRIISDELFAAVQRRVPPRRERQFASRHHPRRQAGRFFLANISVCAICGAPMEGKSVGTYRYDICSAHNHGVGNCPNSQLIPADELEAAVLEALLSKLLTTDRLQKLLTWTNDQLNDGLAELELRVQNACIELEEAERTEQKTTRNFMTMERPTRLAEQILHEQQAQVENLGQELTRLKHNLANSRIEVTEEQVTSYLTRTQALIDAGEYFDLRELVELLCTKISLSL